MRRLLEAGSAELTERGLDAMTIRTVAHQAGVSPATAYTYLASKDHLLAQLFLRHLQAHPAPEPVPGESVANLRAVVRSMADMLASAPEIAAAATRALLGNDPDVARLRVQIGADYVARFESALGQQAVPEILDTLTFLFTGAMLQAGMGFLSYAEMGDRLETSVQQLVGGSMTTTTTGQPIVFDPYDYVFQEDPYPVYSRLRAEDPLHHNEDHDFWVLSRHADVLAALRDHATYSSAMGVSLDRSAWGPQAHTVMSFLAMDPPDHRGSAPWCRGPSRRVAWPELEAQVRAMAERYYDEVLHGDLDWITDFAGRLPMDVISRDAWVCRQRTATSCDGSPTSWCTASPGSSTCPPRG